MLEHLISTTSNSEVVWVHSSRNSQVHTFRKPVAEFATSPEQEGHYEGIVDL